MTEPLIVTPTDCQRCGFCAPNMKTWADANGFDIRHFLRHGIDAELLRATGDALALKAVAEAERRVANERRR
jgi:hypothetical protein